MPQSLLVALGIVVGPVPGTLTCWIISIWKKLKGSGQDSVDRRRLRIHLALPLLCTALSLAYLGILVYMKAIPEALSHKAGYAVGCLIISYIISSLMKLSMVADIFTVFGKCPSYFPRVLIGVTGLSCLTSMAYYIWKSITLLTCIRNLGPMPNGKSLCFSRQGLAIFGYIEAGIATGMYFFVGISPLRPLWNVKSTLRNRVVVCIGFAMISLVPTFTIASAIYIGRDFNNWNDQGAFDDGFLIGELLVWESLNITFAIFFASSKYILKDLDGWLVLVVPYYQRASQWLSKRPRKFHSASFDQRSSNSSVVHLHDQGGTAR